MDALKADYLKHRTPDPAAIVTAPPPPVSRSTASASRVMEKAPPTAKRSGTELAGPPLQRQRTAPPPTSSYELPKTTANHKTPIESIEWGRYKYSAEVIFRAPQLDSIPALIINKNIKMPTPHNIMASRGYYLAPDIGSELLPIDPWNSRRGEVLFGVLMRCSKQKLMKEIGEAQNYLDRQWILWQIFHDNKKSNFHLHGSYYFDRVIGTVPCGEQSTKHPGRTREAAVCFQYQHDAANRKMPLSDPRKWCIDRDIVHDDTPMDQIVPVTPEQTAAYSRGENRRRA